ncbi:hypothetical protein [Jutongia sp.]
MRVITGTNTAEQFHTWIKEQKDSHVAVLLRSGQKAEDFWESGAVTELRLHCQVEKLVWETPEELADRLQACQWREPAGRVHPSKQEEAICRQPYEAEWLLAFGGLYELQEICVARALWLKSDNAAAEDKRVPLLFVAQDMIPASMLPEELLWLRDPEGVTRYLGAFPEGAADTVIMPPTRGQAKRFYELFVKMEEKTGSSLWKELAEPLWLRYGVPEYLAGVLALRYVYRMINGKDFTAMEKLLTQKEVALQDMVWVAREDVLLLAEMAMAGIEMLPRQERLSWQQIKAFYISLCR